MQTEYLKNDCMCIRFARKCTWMTKDIFKYLLLKADGDKEATSKRVPHACAHQDDEEGAKAEEEAN